MSTLEVYANINDNSLYSADATYLTAARNASATGTYGVNETSGPVGQLYSSPNYWVIEKFLEFDTSALPDNCIITGQPILSLWHTASAQAHDFIIEARIKNWGASVTTSDWVNSTTLAGGSPPLLVASFEAKIIDEGNVTRVNFTSESTFASNINKTGVTQLMLNSSKHRLEQTPGVGTWDQWPMSTADDIEANRPKLIINYADVVLPKVVMVVAI